MSFIGKNIRKIRGIKNMSQAAFAELFGLTRASIGSYEEGRAEPKIDVIIQIAKYFGITLEDILTKELKVNELYRFDIFKDGSMPEGRHNLLANRPPSCKFPCVLKERNELYLNSLGDENVLKSLPKMIVPLKLGNEARGFEQTGHDMQFDNRGILAGDLVVGTPFSSEQLDAHQEGYLFIVITKEAIHIRRLGKVTKKDVVLLADNTSAKPVAVKRADIAEVWELKGVFSTNLQRPNT